MRISIITGIALALATLVIYAALEYRRADQQRRCMLRHTGHEMTLHEAWSMDFCPCEIDDELDPCR